MTRYAQVDHAIQTNPKMAWVMEDDQRLGRWLRLLLAADAAYPAPADRPRWADDEFWEHMVQDRLVVALPRDQYYMNGMDERREHDPEATGRRGGIASGKARRAKAKGVPEGPSPKGVREPPNQTKPDQTKPDHTNQTTPDWLADARDNDDDHLEAYYQLTASWPTGKVLPWLNELASTYGSSETADALAAEWATSSDRKTLLSRTQARLAKASHELAKQRQAAQEQAAREQQARIDAMPLEQRKANMRRLREAMVASGLVDGEGGQRID